LYQSALDAELLAALRTRRQVPLDHQPVSRLQLARRIPWKQRFRFIVRAIAIDRIGHQLLP
jgi:hypothetical protein